MIFFSPNLRLQLCVVCVCIDPEPAKMWTDADVVSRLASLFISEDLADPFVNKVTLELSMVEMNNESVKVCRYLLVKRRRLLLFTIKS